MTERAAMRGPRPRIRRHRIVVAVAMGLLAVGALTACRSEAGSAAFVGNTRITDSHVDTVAAGAPATATNAKVTVLGTIVFNEIASKYAAEKGYPTPALTDDVLGAIATDSGTTLAKARSDAYVVNAAMAQLWIQELATKAAPVTPSDATLMTIYNRAVAVGAAQADDFAGFKTALLQYPQITQIFGLEHELTDASARYDVSVSPRYAQTCTVAPCAPIEYPLLQLQAQSSGSFDVALVPLGDGNASPAVVDAPSPVAPAPSQQPLVPGPPPPGA